MTDMREAFEKWWADFTSGDAEGSSRDRGFAHAGFRAGWHASAPPTTPVVQSPSPAVRVKALEWESAVLEHWITGYQAESAFGWYRVGKNPDDTFCWWFGRGFRSHSYRTMNETRAAAQADYERRILSTLDPAPVQAGEPVGYARTIDVSPNGHPVEGQSSFWCSKHQNAYYSEPVYLHPSDAYARGAEQMRERAELAVTRAMIALPYTSLEDVDAIGRIISALPLTEGEK